MTDYEEELRDIIKACKPGNFEIDDVYGAEEYAGYDPGGQSLLVGEIGRTEVGLLGHKKNVKVDLGVVGFAPSLYMESGYACINEAKGAVEKWQYYNGMGGTNALNECQSATATELNATDLTCVGPLDWTAIHGTGAMDDDGTYKYKVFDAGNGTYEIHKLHASSAQSDVTIQFYVTMDSNTSGFRINGDTDFEDDVTFYIGWGNNTAGYVSYYDGSWHDICTFSVDTWYKVKIVTNDTAKTFDLYIDDVLQGDDLPYYENFTSINDIIFVYPTSGTEGIANVAFPACSDFLDSTSERNYISFNVQAPIYEGATVTAATLAITVDDLFWGDGNVTIHGISSGLDSSISLADIAAMTFTTASVAAELEEGSNEINVLTIIQELVAAGDVSGLQGFRISPTTAQAILLGSPTLSITVTQPDSISCTVPSLPTQQEGSTWVSAISVSMVYKEQDKET